MSEYIPNPYYVQYQVFAGIAKNATSVSTTAVAADLNSNPSVTGSPVQQDNLLILVHAVDRGANLASLGAPNNVGNPWNLIASTDYGPDGPKLRVWAKTVTLAEQQTSSTYTVTSAVASYHQLRGYVIEAGVINPNQALWPVATASKFGLPHTHPKLPIPSGYKNLERCYGLALGFIAGSSRASKGWKTPDFSGGSSPGWYGGGDYVTNADTSNPSDDIHLFPEISQFVLDPAKQIPVQGPTPSPYWQSQGFGQCPTVSVSILLLPWTGFRAPTAGLMSGLSDTFTTPLDSRVTTTGTPSINSSNQLVLHGGDSVTYAGVRSLRESQVTVEVPQAAVTGTDSVQLSLQSQLWPKYNQIFVYTYVNPSTGACNLVAGCVDNLHSGGGYYVGAYDATAMRWWRVRVEGGVLIVDTSPDKVTWFTRFEGNPDAGFSFLQDQLDDMQLTLRVVGSSSTTGIFDNLGQPFSWQNDGVPTSRSLTWMGSTSGLRTAWPGRDVIVGVCDQGTSQAVRSAQGITMLKRTYLGSSGPPAFGNGETFPGEPHGCFVTSNAVPPGGKFVEAVITSYSGSSSTSTICGALLWCAAQGAKVINLSFGGGADDPIFRDTFDYLATAYDVQIYIAAGNSNVPYVEIPAAYSSLYGNVHSVGAFDELTSTRAYFSNHHELMSGVAPGLDVTGLSPSGRPLTGSGTSYASPLSAQLCARLLSGAVYAPAHAGAVLDQNTRDTGTGRSEQGGGAYDLGRAVAAIDQPEKGLLPDIAMPRFTDGEWAEVAEKFNTLAEEIDLQGTICLVRRTDVANLHTSFHAAIPWEQLDVDTFGGMWDPDYPGLVFIQTTGLYLLTLQARFYPFSSGKCSAAILLNGGDITQNALEVDRKPFSTDGEGVTCSMTTVVILYEGDFLLCDIWQSSGADLLCAHTDFGGTYLSVARLAPLAPTLSGTATPVTALTATAADYRTVNLAWTNPDSDDQDATLVRRKAGTSPPSSLVDGTAIGTVAAPGSTLADTTVAPATTYTYAAFARTSSYVYADPATATVTTPAAPAPPAPITGLAVTTVSTSTLGLTWTNPTSSNFAGTMIRRKDGTSAPTGPTDGTLVADLDPTATSFTDTHLSPLTGYAYAAFSHTADPVYAAGATTSRSTTVDVSIHGSTNPTLTSIRSDGPFQVGVQFKVSAAAWFKAFRFYRANATILGPFQFALWDLAVQYGSSPPSGVATNGLVIGTNVTYNPNTSVGWQTAAPTTVPVLTANRAYVAAVYVPKGLPEYRPFWAGTGYGTSGLFTTAGSFTLTAPSRANATFTAAQETYNTSTATVPTTSGGTDGPCWFIDMLVNPVT